MKLYNSKYSHAFTRKAGSCIIKTTVGKYTCPVQTASTKDTANPTAKAANTSRQLLSCLSRRKNPIILWMRTFKLVGSCKSILSAFLVFL